MRHHTKDKGDLAVAEVIADLMRAGAHVCLPLSRTPPLRPDRRFTVYASDSPNTSKVCFDAVWGCSHRPPEKSCGSSRVHNRQVNLDEVDAFGIFCPQMNRVYYVRSEEMRGHHTLFTIRVTKSRNDQIENMKPWNRFVDARRLFGPVAQMDEPGASNS